jgi:hypothetical protein
MAESSSGKGNMRMVSGKQALFHFVIIDNIAFTAFGGRHFWNVPSELLFFRSIKSLRYIFADLSQYSF